MPRLLAELRHVVSVAEEAFVELGTRELADLRVHTILRVEKMDVLGMLLLHSHEQALVSSRSGQRTEKERWVAARLGSPTRIHFEHPYLSGMRALNSTHCAASSMMTVSNSTFKFLNISWPLPLSVAHKT